MNNKKTKLISLIVVVVLVLLTIYIVFNTTDNVKDTEDSYNNLDIISNIKNYDIKLDSAKLIIEEGNKFTISTNNKYISLTEEEIKITIPKNYNFNNLNIVSDGGIINISNLNVNELSLQLKASSLTLDDVVVNEKLTINGGAGTIDVKNSDISNLSLVVGVGNCNISASLKNNNVIEAGVGQLNIELLDNIDDYKIKLTKGIGDITINNLKITDNNTFGNGNKNISLTGGIGPISITSK